MEANVNLWILMLFAIPGGHCYYNCEKPSMECQNGGTCSITSKTCTCTAAYQGDDCAVERTRINGEGCTQNTCTQGLCLAGATCACPPDWYGTRCQLERLRVMCDADRMTILAYPFPEFNGKFYVMGKGNQNACILKPIPDDKSGTRIPADADGLYLEVNHNDPVCGNAVLQIEETTQNVIYLRKIETAYMVNDTTFDLDHFDYFCRYVPVTQLVSGSGVYVSIDEPATAAPVEATTSRGYSGVGLSLSLMLVCLLGGINNN